MDHQPHSMAHKVTRARTLALELDACELINNATVAEAQAVIAGILFQHPELSDDKVCAKALQCAVLR